MLLASSGAAAHRRNGSLKGPFKLRWGSSLANRSAPNVEPPAHWPAGATLGRLLGPPWAALSLFSRSANRTLPNPRRKCPETPFLFTGRFWFEGPASFGMKTRRASCPKAIAKIGVQKGPSGLPSFSLCCRQVLLSFLVDGNSSGNGTTVSGVPNLRPGCPHRLMRTILMTNSRFSSCIP